MCDINLLLPCVLYYKYGMLSGSPTYATSRKATAAVLGPLLVLLLSAHGASAAASRHSRVLLSDVQVHWLI
jgi:hypothetical protein